MVPDPALTVSELFYSIQGESSYTGYPCVFIRLSDCNLRCTYCDARYTYEDAGRKQQISEILNFVKRYPVFLVEITGGEPLLQDGIYPLMDQLLEMKKTVLLETNGSRNIKDVPDGVIKIMDLKCPDSGMSEHMELSNLALLNHEDEIKFVISSRKDYDWAVEMLQTHILDVQDLQVIRKRPRVLFSPVTSCIEPPRLARWIRDDHLPVRLQLQLHATLWPDQKRGV